MIIYLYMHKYTTNKSINEHIIMIKVLTKHKILSTEAILSTYTHSPEHMSIIIDYTKFNLHTT